MLVTTFLLFFTACENTDETSEGIEQNATLEIVSDIVKLVDDSTNIAGYIEVASSGPKVDLKWNFPPECNVDTTQTAFKIGKGVCKIPVKWAKEKDGAYTSSSIAFDGGVLISAGNISKYVHLVWADKIDSTEITKNREILTRSEDVIPKAVVINLTPEQVNMDIVVGGGVFVEYTGASGVAVDQNQIAVSTNIDKSKIPIYITEPKLIEFSWINGIAPDVDFATKVDFKAGNIVKTCYINYSVPVEEPLVWEFISSSITDGNELPATNATLSVTVKTNKPWSLECTDAEISPLPDYGSGIGNKTLTLHIKDNPGPDTRPISVLVKSQGVLKEALTFTQQAPNTSGKTFEFILSDPVNNATIPSAGTTAIVKVKTDVAWWINLNGSIKNFPAGTLEEKTGTVTIPASSSTENQIVTYLIGYDNTIVESISYIQPAQGSDIGGTLDYESSNLPGGNIPTGGGVYTFTFTGTYTGNLQMRALLDGVAQTPSSAVTNKQPQVTIPANTGAIRNVSFQYKMADGNWIALPTSTDKIQDAGTAVGETLNYVSSNLPAGNIPATVTVYTFNFEGGYVGKLRVRAVDATTGTILFNGPIGTTHSPKVTVPANTDTTPRNIKFQYRLIDVANAPWEDLPASTNRIQDAGTGIEGTLDYVSSNLPTGNIPLAGGTYQFTFEGTYSGNLDVRALSEGNVLATGTAVTNKQPQVTIPANSATGTRPVTFEYRKGNGAWTALPTSTNRTQDGTNSGVIVPSVTLTPGGVIPEEGGTYTCTFTGGSGNVILRAMKKRVDSSTWTEAARTASTVVPGDVSIDIPDLDGLNATIAFEYSTDGGNTWIAINDNREQLNTWLIIDVPPYDTIVPATNGSLSFVLRGNYKKPVTITVKYGNEVIGTATGTAPSTLVVPVADNPSSSSRRISFSYPTIDGQGWVGAALTQAGK